MTSCSAVERPKVVEIVSWAASLGDRSENADYLYGKKRLREIDRRLSHLAADHESGEGRRSHRLRSTDQVRFGATVELADENDDRRTLTLVGDDETDAAAGRIGWSAPLARALIGAKVGDERIVRLPSGEKSYEVIAIRYPARLGGRTGRPTRCGGSAGIASAQASAIALSAATAACARRCRRS